MRKKLLWMREGTRILASGKHGEIVSIWSTTINGVVYVDYIDVCLDGNDQVESFSPDDVQRNRMQKEVAHA